MSGWEDGWGLDLLVALQHRLLPALAPFCAVFHLLGSEWCYLLLLPLIYWCYSPALGRRLAVRFLLSVWLNAWVKDLLHRPRPASVDPRVEQLFTDTAPGLPSGHVQQAALVYGSLAHWSRRRGAAVAAVVLTLLMAFSRMLAGMHYLQDVLGGLLLGVALLVLLPRAEARILPWLRPLGLRRHLELAALAVAALALLTRALAGAQPAVVGHTVKPLGMLLGLLFGFAVERAGLRFAPPTHGLCRAAGGLLGLASVVLLYVALAKLPGAELAAVRFGRYAVLGLWIAAGVPWLLLRTRLATRAADVSPD